MDDLISRKAAIQVVRNYMIEFQITNGYYHSDYIERKLYDLPSAEPERKEVIPHKNYQYLSDYWCECGNHLGKKYEVTYCSDCGRKVNWDE